MLKQLPLCDIELYAPGAYFSVLQPRTRLPPHTGMSNTRLDSAPAADPAAGLPLPGRLETRDWQRRQAWVFDDTIEHEAWNDSDQVRIILLLENNSPEVTRSSVYGVLAGRCSV